LGEADGKQSREAVNGLSVRFVLSLWLSAKVVAFKVVNIANYALFDKLMESLAKVRP
jgi:hypothetical protein